MWRSWIAALCVALVAFVTLEQASTAHALEPGNAVAVVSADAGVNVASVEVPQDDRGAPEGAQQQSVPHHCSGAHTTNAPPLQQASVPARLAQALAFVRTDNVALDHASQGLERPPRAITIV